MNFASVPRNLSFIASSHAFSRVMADTSHSLYKRRRIVKGGALHHVKSYRREGGISCKNLTEAAMPLPWKLQFTREIMRLKMNERQAPADVTVPRYRKAGRKDKKKIPGEFCQNTDYHRKYAIALLRNAGKTQLRRIGKEAARVKITAKTRVKRVYTRVYDEEVERALVLYRGARQNCLASKTESVKFETEDSVG
jgi:hypothetical protein